MEAARGSTRFVLPEEDGYRGIWYCNQPSNDEFRFKYSGGMATYPQQHAPIAIYRKEVHRTFFVYGGTTARQPGQRAELLHMISYFDHASGAVPRPRVLLNKRTDDAHDNPTLAMDAAGHLWVFSPSHGTSRPSYIHRSTRPYSIEEFELLTTTNFSYPQAWFIEGQGFVFLHTRYGGGSQGISAARSLMWKTSAEGQEWSRSFLLAGAALGHYQISWPHGGVLATAFDIHPPPLGLNARANLYYLQTADQGRTWLTADGRHADLPVRATNHPALIYDSMRDKELVYLKDLNFDADGRPVILFLTSRGYEPGPRNGPRRWRTIRWTGQEWEVRDFTTSLNNYDHGSLYIEDDGGWRVIAPTEPGPQPYNPGGEMVLWTSANRGRDWTKVRQLTKNSPYNHNYARRPLNARPEFYALWADGHGRQRSACRIYFTDREGTAVWRLPCQMTEKEAKPELVSP